MTDQIPITVIEELLKTGYVPTEYLSALEPILRLRDERDAAVQRADLAEQRELQTIEHWSKANAEFKQRAEEAERGLSVAENEIAAARDLVRELCNIMRLPSETYRQKYAAALARADTYLRCGQEQARHAAIVKLVQDEIADGLYDREPDPEEME